VDEEEKNAVPAGQNGLRRDKKKGGSTRELGIRQVETSRGDGRQTRCGGGIWGDNLKTEKKSKKGARGVSSAGLELYTGPQELRLPLSIEKKPQ